MDRVINRLYITLLAALLCVGCSFSEEEQGGGASSDVALEQRYGVVVDGYVVEEHKVRSGQTMGNIMNFYGRSARDIDRVDRASRAVFALNNMRAGNRYFTFVGQDSLGRESLDYLVYERDKLNYVLFVMRADSVSVHLREKPSKSLRQRRVGVIRSSLSGAIVDAQMPYELGAELEQIYQWSIDLFRIKLGDRFVVLYDERFVDDSVSIGLGAIRGAKFTHEGVDYYAIPFEQGGRVEFWSERGESLRQDMLKAPLKYSRVTGRSSQMSSDMVRRTAHGVDYAAPTGTPVVAVADGVVVFRGGGADGGNCVKIEHGGGVVTGYIHLSRFARGVERGGRVLQGDLIGYVGSDGSSEESHLDYRVWRGEVAINPLEIEPRPMDPISQENRVAFEQRCKQIVAELNGDVQLDIVEK